MPDKVGRYTIVIKYGGDEIPTSPYRVRATSSGDASKCTVAGKTSKSSRCLGNGHISNTLLTNQNAVFNIMLSYKMETAPFPQVQVSAPP